MEDIVAQAIVSRKRLRTTPQQLIRPPVVAIIGQQHANCYTKLVTNNRSAFYHDITDWSILPEDVTEKAIRMALY
jgi:hypothetical protein